MGMNDTPKGERVQIALFGKRNAGKSSLINAITGQPLSIVSDVKGTTTDPVYKAMEILPIGPVMLVDTPGLDDKGDLGQLRIEKTMEVLGKTDLALIVTDSSKQENLDMEKQLEKVLKQQEIPYLWVYNKAELCEKQTPEEHKIYVSAKTGKGILELKEKIPDLLPKDKERPLVRDLLGPQDMVVLVVPIDKAAPKGRLILPQQQVIRDVLEAGGIPVVVRDTELAEVFGKLKQPPKMVITDSQAFEQVANVTPKAIPLTSFSILMARYKGNLQGLAKDVQVLDSLRDGDTILMAEGCTHHRQCDDIGTVKIPKWIKEYTGKKLQFETASGGGYPSDLKKYAMVVHCGGCMLQEKEMKLRMKRTKEQGVPIVNYGILIAYIKGILKRSMELFSKEI